MTEINEDTVRAEARAWLEANWKPDYGLVEWRLKLAQSGWGVPHWPSRWYGRDLPVGLVPVVEEEFKRIGAIGVAKVGIRTLAAATILAHGSDWQKEKFLLRILTGEDIWCQLFSEPGSGSDVAGAVTRAEFRGNQWVVNGQKVWTTSAHKAHWGLLLARSDWDQPKHRGLSYFIIDMKQPGVTVQPLRQMNGYASFNQVFFTDAKVEPEFLVSDIGNGWAVTTTTLMHERRGADGLRSWRSPPTSRAGPMTRNGKKSARLWSPTSGIRNVRAASICSWSGRGRPERSTIRRCGKRSPRCWRWRKPRNGPLVVLARHRSRVGRRAPRAPSASWRPASSPARRLACIRRCWGQMRC